MLQVFDYHDKLKNKYGTIFDMATVFIIRKWNSKTSSLVQLKKKKTIEAWRNTMESSMIVADQFSWLLLITLAHEFTSPQMYLKAFV